MFSSLSEMVGCSLSFFRLYTLTSDDTTGMTQNMITAARLIAHKSINGKYQSLMQLDQMDNLGL
jgi:hypothetical protein